MSLFKEAIQQLYLESDAPAILVKRELEQFFKKKKDEFVNKNAAKALLKKIKDEDDDIKLISLVGKFFSFLEVPEFHEDFINKIMGLL
jgi:hypothetical protein